MRKISRQFHSNPVLVPPHKPLNHVMDIYYVQTYSLQKVDICTRMDLVPLDYGKFAHTFHLMMWLFWFITGITFRRYYVLWWMVALLVWICI